MTDHPDKTTNEDTTRVVARRDELGRIVETVEVSDIEAATHWDDDLWEPV